MTDNDTDTRRIGMATSYPNSTTDFASYISVGDRFESLERAVSYWADYLLDIFCGAVVNWVYSKSFNEWSLQILYWESKKTHNLRPQIIGLMQRLFYFSGFCSRERGRHMHYKTKLQRN